MPGIDLRASLQPRGGNRCCAGFHRLLVSGTASIARDGKTEHIGNARAQIERSMQVVAAILDNRGGMTLDRHCVRHGFFKSPATHLLFADWLGAATDSQSNSPVVSAGCDILPGQFVIRDRAGEPFQAVALAWPSNRSHMTLESLAHRGRCSCIISFPNFLLSGVSRLYLSSSQLYCSLLQNMSSGKTVTLHRHALGEIARACIHGRSRAPQAMLVARRVAAGMLARIG